MTSSTETTNQEQDGRRASVARDGVTARVIELASGCRSPNDFLRKLAADLLRAFPVEAVVMTHPEWDGPMMLVSGQTPRVPVDSDSVLATLEGSTRAANACDLPAPDEAHPARGLHVRLDDGAGVTAVLLLYQQGDPPEAAEQIRDLKRLVDYSEACRQALTRFQNDSTTTRSATPTRMPALRSFHQDLDLQATAYRIVNESRRLASVDRVTLLLGRRGVFRVESVSGVAVVDRHANSITCTEQLVRRAIVLDRPLGFPTQDPLPPQIESAMEHYIDETNVASALLWPIRPPQESSQDSDGETAEPMAVLLFESFSEGPIPPAEIVREIVADAGLALRNSLDHSRIFGRRLLQTLGDWFGGSRLSWTVTALALAASFLVASLVVKIDHEIIATGTAEPSLRQHVFAQTDGIVRTIRVADGDAVTRGEVLLEMENAELEATAESLSGEIQTTTKRLSSVRSVLLDPATDPNRAARLAIEKRQLESELTGLDSQLKLIQRQRKQLVIRAPIDGFAAAWQVDRRLMNRPVRRGDRLVTVIDRDGPWSLKLEISDRDAAEVLAALDDEPTLETRFAASSDPRSTYAARLHSVATAARRNAAGVNVVDAVADITDDTDELRTLNANRFLRGEARSGVEATAKITCGRRTVLGSWFGDVADFVDRNILFYVR